MQNQARLPPKVASLLDKHVSILEQILGDNLRGVYIHGSLALGGFEPAQSDIDYIVVIENPLTSLNRKQLSAYFLTHFDDPVPAKGGIEMSIIVRQFVAENFQYPTPYEFHMGTKEQVAFHAKPHDDVFDLDLAGHLKVVKEAGICVYGSAIENIFHDIPEVFFLQSIIQDLKQSYEDVMTKTKGETCIVPRYAVLNFCRTLALQAENRLFSKVEGGQWALENLPTEYHPLFLASLEDYRSPDSSNPVNAALLMKFTEFAYNTIKNAAIYDS